MLESNNTWLSRFGSIALLFVSCVYFYYIYFYASIGRVLPDVSDDIPYLSGATVFAQISSVKARTMINESVSVFFQADWYGVTFPIFFGSIFKIFGVNPKLMVYTNIGLIAILIGLFLYLFKNSKDKFLVLLAFLLSPQLAVFLFRSMPTCLNALQGFILFWLLYKIGNQEDAKKRARLVLIFVLATLFCCLFRNYFVFYIIGLLPMSRSKKSFILNGLLFLVTFFLSSLYLKYFSAISLETFRAFDTLNPWGMINALRGSFRHNRIVFQTMVSNFFMLRWYSLEVVFLLIIVLPFVTFLKGFKVKNKAAMGMSAVALLNFAIMFGLYAIEGDYFLRHSLHFFLPLCFIFFELYKGVLGRSMVMGLLTCSFLLLVTSKAIPNTISYQHVIDRRIYSDSLYAPLQSIRDYITDDADRDETTVLIHRNILRKLSKIQVIYSLPRVSKNGKLIRYTSNPDTKEIEPMALFHKLPVQYFLIPETLTEYDNSLILHQKDFKLCKNPQP